MTTALVDYQKQWLSPFELEHIIFDNQQGLGHQL